MDDDHDERPGPGSRAPSGGSGDEGDADPVSRSGDDPTDGDPTDSEATDGEPTDCEATGSEATDGDPTDGEPTDCEATGSEATDGEPTDGDPTGDAPPLTHTDEAGDVQMVDVGDKPDTARRAVARGWIRLSPSTVAAVRANDVSKGDVLATARVGAVQAVKHTWEAIPMCHAIPITNVETEFAVDDDRIRLTVAVETTGKTGCEMEALEGVTTGLNVVWDMVKSAEKADDGTYPDTRIGGVEVIEKTKRPL